MILAQLKQVYFAIFNSTLIKSLLPSAGLSNEAGMNRDCCRSKSCQDMKINVCLFFNGMRKEFSPGAGVRNPPGMTVPFQKG